MSKIELDKSKYLASTNSVDKEELRNQVEANSEFPHFLIDNFLDLDFAERVYTEFPTFEVAALNGRRFRALNEQNKVQLTDASQFPVAIKTLNEILSSPEWLDMVSYALQVPHLVVDTDLVGGGIHQTGPRGRLDVHVDFNYEKRKGLFRRVNILVFFNKHWPDEWGGRLELWDADVKRRLYSFTPKFNRCVAFETSETSFHGVTTVRCPKGQSRRSFAAYYYTEEPPSHWTGQAHSTLFRPRPNEYFRSYIGMPSKYFLRRIRRRWRDIKARCRSWS